MLCLFTFFHFVVVYLIPLIVAAPADREGRSILQPNGAPLISTLAQPRSSLATFHGSIFRLNSTVDYPVRCFHPIPIPYKTANAEDCHAIIDNIILRYAEPFAELSWGYTDKQDINLASSENSKWILGECVIFVRCASSKSVDRFRIVDVAARAKDLIRDCVVGTKEGYGGYSDIGHLPMVASFYVAVGGQVDDLANSTLLSPATNDTIISASSNKTVLSLSRNTERSLD